MCESLTRRKALGVVAVVPVAAALSTPAFASQGEDAELRRLWDEWNAQWLVCEQTNTAAEQVRMKVREEAGPHWEFVTLKGHKPYRAIFISSGHDDDTQKAVVLKAKTLEQAHVCARKAGSALLDERKERERLAQKRYKYAAVKLADNRAVKHLKQIESQIFEMPAEGFKGIAIKLAPTVFFESAVNEGEEIASVYETAVRLSDGVHRRSDQAVVIRLPQEGSPPVP